ncbi:histidinol-phosphatase (PHP family) [Desulfonispora thiosulfatigenes DSM 11270]|uniref:Histidinol-phosphatase n=1 Tax=Desulfonispora thiosulfatigenes DSM 11270 TaxID=656914 RepID=A0A1W1VSY7_DESTI|nr:histidinol-phosphatase HisJ family protein [Desulfonispora thiosulfatigenes]SMB96459.1 histidinol-phosphatase (PHP family) [Desulfonispora thiosulfatigenes DSM 11270]
MLVDLHVHAIGHDDRKHNLDNLIPYLEKAKTMNIKEIGFADHDRYFDILNLNLYEDLQKLYPEIKINVGLEVDYFPDKIFEITKIINKFDFDYIIGSVHYIDEWMFDSDKQKQGFLEKDIDEVYKQYLSRIVGAAQTGLFPLIGHLDLIKIFGFKPTKNISETFLEAIKLIQKTGVVIELNTNGWYKPVNELYPSEELIKLCFNYNIPITLSSDAHQAEHVGRDVDKALNLAKKCGYKKIATFANKKVNFVNI